MLHARADYDTIQPPNGGPPAIPEDEPVALIRGQDPIGWRAVLAYCAIAEGEGVQPDLIDTLRRHAEKMREWCERVGHGLPDAPADVLR